MFETRFSRLLAVLLCLSFLLMVPGPAATAKLAESSGQMPLYFVENRGQLDDRVAYYVLGGPTQVYFAVDGVTFALMEPDEGRGEASLARSSAVPDLPPDATRAVAAGLSGDASPLRARARVAAHAGTRQRWAVKLDFVGANPHARLVGESQTGGVVSYFKGAPDQWHAGLPTYARVVYGDLWPGIDLTYYGQAGQLKYEFLVHPGADPAQIRLRYRGAAGVGLNAGGQMEVTTPLGGLTDDAPIAWQEIDGHRAPVGVAYDLDTADAIRTAQSATSQQPHRDAVVTASAIGDSQSFGFSLGAFDRSQPLVIDPAVLVYCGYIGGLYYDSGSGIAVDGAGNAYVAGTTTSTQDSFPVAVGPDLTHNGSDDAFVAKVSASGATLIYVGYIGGEGGDVGYGIAVDGDGNAYVTGQTNSAQDTFPVVGGPDPTFNGEWDAFVAKVSAFGTALVYAGYIGGLDDDIGSGIAVDGAGNAYVTGNTASTQDSFPVTGGPDPTYSGGGSDAFVAKVSTSGAALVYAGYIGGAGYDIGNDIAVDGAGNAYVTGWTNSAQNSFPVAGGPDLTHNGGVDAFVAKVSASGAALVYAGYIGGSGADVGSGIAADGAGNAYVTGHTASTQVTFPVTGELDLTFNGADDAFVAKVSASGAALVYSGYIGGSGGDYGVAIAVDGAGNAYIVGYTTSAQDSFPVAGGPDATYNGGLYDAFVAKVSASRAALAYAGYIGGSGDDVGNGIALHGAGSAYVTGYTNSSHHTFPVVGGPDLIYNSYYDAFVARVLEVGSAAYLPLAARGN